MTLEPQDRRPSPRWKRLVITSAAAGVGFALTLAVIVGSAVWYDSRPKNWDKEAIRAKYDHAVTDDIDCYLLKAGSARDACEETHGDVVLTYDLKNTTDHDYRIDEQSGLEIMESDKNVLEPTLLVRGQDRGTSYWRLQMPLFIPAHRTVAVDIRGPDACPRCNADKLNSFVRESIPKLILFDPATRCEIILPKP